jgi:hypothetical protein
VSITTTTSRIDRRYLENKTKVEISDLLFMILEQNRKSELSLRNCLALASRNKDQGDWAHVTRFCQEAGVVRHILRVETDSQNVYHCPDCGYTRADAAYHMDHRICELKGGPPMPKGPMNEDEKALLRVLGGEPL